MKSREEEGAAEDGSISRKGYTPERSVMTKSMRIMT